MQFTWTQGEYEAEPPQGFEDYFGAGPLWRFINYDGTNTFDILERIRDFPEGTTPEETMRMLMGETPSYTIKSVQGAMGRLIEMIDNDPEIEVSFTT